MRPWSSRTRVAVVVLLTALAALVAPGAAAAVPAETIPFRVVGLNDLHGNLEPPTGSSGRVTQPDGAVVEAGGAAFLATHLKQLRGEVRDSAFVGQGDLIGASPLSSALFHDEPTIELLRSLGMRTSAAGNHEFDEGYRELLRIQTGGCHPVDGCQFRPTYRGSGFPYLSANVTLRQSPVPGLLPFWISTVQGVPVGFIGMPLEGTPGIVSAEGIRDLRFGDEIAAADRYSAVLDRLGVKTIVLLLHQGDNLAGANPPDGCNIVPGAGREIAEGVSPRIDAVLAGHSHQQFNCSVPDPAGNPRPYIQGAAFGRMLSVVDLQIDRRTRDAVRDRTVAFNRVVTRTVTPDPAAQALVAEAVTKAAPIGNRPVGTITADIVRAAVPSGESPLGDLIADSQLAATAGAGAQIALMNPGGVRADLTYASSPAGEGDGVVTYAEAFTVQPFGNVMTTITLTGAQLDAVLEQQWQPTATRILQPSAGFTYVQAPAAPVGSRVSGIALNGVPIDPAATYRVSVNNFLADGGDGFTVLTEGTDRTGGVVDLDAFTAYLTANPGLAPPAPTRITVG